jgi:hypothetical protein
MLPVPDTHHDLSQISYRIENRRRDRLYGKPVADARVDMSDLADKVCQLQIAQIPAQNRPAHTRHQLTVAPSFTGAYIPLRSIIRFHPASSI